MLFDGLEGVEKNISAAVMMCRKAVKLGNEDSIYNLPSFLNSYAINICEERGCITPKALELFREAAGLGYDLAGRNLCKNLYNYSLMLYTGVNGVEKNIPKAIELFREAASLGNPDAIRNLSMMLASLNR